MEDPKTGSNPEQKKMQFVDSRGLKPEARKTVGTKTGRLPGTTHSPGVAPKKEKSGDAVAEFRAATTVEQLVELYNDMVPTAHDFGMVTDTTKSFPDVKTGKLACERLHGQIQASRARHEKAATRASTTTAATTAPAKSGASKETTKMAAKSKKTAAKKTAKKVNGNGNGARSTRFASDMKITVSAAALKENPFRKGTDAAKRFEVVRRHHGKTVGDFAKVKDGNILRTSVQKGHASVK